MFKSIKKYIKNIVAFWSGRIPEEEFYEVRLVNVSKPSEDDYDTAVEILKNMGMAADIWTKNDVEFVVDEYIEWSEDEPLTEKEFNKLIAKLWNMGTEGISNDNINNEIREIIDSREESEIEDANEYVEHTEEEDEK